MAIERQRILPDPARPLPIKTKPAPQPQARPGLDLLQAGLVAPHDLVQALAAEAQGRGRLSDILRARRLIDEAALQGRLAQDWQTTTVDLVAQPPDPRLIDRLGYAACLQEGLMPWRQAGSVTVIATAHPEDFTRHRPRLTHLFGPVAMALAPMAAIETALLKARGPALDRLACTRVAEVESCRNFSASRGAIWAALVLVLVLALGLLAPLTLWALAVGWAVLTLALATALKFAATLAALRRPPPEPPAPPLAVLPMVTIMVALYKEANIAQRLVRRLSRLDYPRDRLEILLVVEEEDSLTRRALARADLPGWMRVVVVPDGRLKTKPRALNHALLAARGQIVGLYDAEDAPEPDQLRKVVARFAARGSRVACLQGMLDYYNPHTNWLSRCFTMEYAAWFRILLPGMARLGLAVPLGGTTLFFRRDALERLGAWDAHNVTEDADLGMRLARHGYVTELIETTTFEEANCRAIPWVKQRSRWLKGYMMTYGVHLRDPRLLLRQLGWRKFLGFHVFFATTLSQFLLAPVLWTFWITTFGFTHPLLAALPAWAGMAMIGLFLVTEALQLAVTIAALRLTPNRINPLWALALHVYFPLGSLASYKAAWEVLAKPFWWDKTSHGHFDPVEG